MFVGYQIAVVTGSWEFIQAKQNTPVQQTDPRPVSNTFTPRQTSTKMMAGDPGTDTEKRDALKEVSVQGSPRVGLAGATFGFFIGFAGVVMYGPAADQFEGALGLSGLLLGLLVGAPSLLGSLVRIPAGAWADEVGPRKPFLALLGLSAVGMLGFSGLLVLVGTDGLGTRHYPLIFVFGALSGCGIGTFSVGLTQTSYWYQAEKQGRALAVYAGLGNSSPGMFTLLLPALIGVLGLTTTYLVWILFLVGGIAVYAVVAADPYYFQLRRQGLDAEQAERAGRELGQEIFPNEDAWGSVRQAAGLLRTWLLVALYFTSLGGFLALTVWFPSYWSSFHGVGARTAGLITALGFALLSTFVRIPGGFLSDRVGGERVSAVSFGTVSAAALLLMVADSIAVAVLGMLLLAVGIGVANAAVTQLVPLYVPKAVGGASGIVGGVEAFGGFAIPPVLGLFVDQFGVSGYATGFVVIASLGAMGFVLSAVLDAKLSYRAV